MKIYFIRHGETQGNREKRYVGTTDEGILDSAKNELIKKTMPAVEKIYVSPMKRCMETAEILYPKREYIVIDNFRECDFGDFEYLSYNDLKDNKDYIAFIESMGKTGFPNGETKDSFQKRCIIEFEKIIKNRADIAFIVHGGTIMSILDKYSYPHKDYFTWQCKNRCGFSATLKYIEERPCLVDIEEI